MHEKFVHQVINLVLVCGKRDQIGQVPGGWGGGDSDI